MPNTEILTFIFFFTDDLQEEGLVLWSNLSEVQKRILVKLPEEVQEGDHLLNRELILMPQKDLLQAPRPLVLLAREEKVKTNVDVGQEELV